MRPAAPAHAAPCGGSEDLAKTLSGLQIFRQTLLWGGGSRENSKLANPAPLGICNGDQHTLGDDLLSRFSSFLVPLWKCAFLILILFAATNNKVAIEALSAPSLSQNRDADAHECLAEACAAAGDSAGEARAAKAAIARWERTEEECSRPLPGADAPRRAEAVKKRMHAAARKRELGFRVARLEMELRAS